jgi:hypothetical protein
MLRYNITIDIKETECEGVDCINLVQNRESGSNKPSGSMQSMGIS